MRHLAVERPAEFRFVVGVDPRVVLTHAQVAKRIGSRRPED